MRFGIDPVFGTDVTAVGAAAPFGVAYFHAWHVTTRSDENRSPNPHFDGTRLDCCRFLVRHFRLRDLPDDSVGSIRTYCVHDQVGLSPAFGLEILTPFPEVADRCYCCATT
jgi:hypothetical protein